MGVYNSVNHMLKIVYNAVVFLVKIDPAFFCKKNAYFIFRLPFCWSKGNVAKRNLLSPQNFALFLPSAQGCFDIPASLWYTVENFP